MGSEKWGTHLTYFSRLKPSMALVQSVSYENLRVNLENAPSDDPTETFPLNDLSLQTIRYGATVLTRLDERWSLAASLQPTIASDLKESLSSEDLRFNGGVIFRRKIDAGFSISVGLGYVNNFGASRLLPIVGFVRVTQDSLLRATLPLNLEYTRFVSERVHIGGAIRTSGGSFHVHPDIPNASDKNDLNYSVGTIGPTIRLLVSRCVSMNAETGVTLYNRWRLKDDTTDIATNNFKNTWYARAGIEFRL
jgi:hypothetical protein